MRQQKMTDEVAEEIAIAGFGLLAEEPERTMRFLALSGLDPANLREIAATRDFQTAVLAHIRGDESLLLVLAARLGIDANRVSEAERQLSGAAGDM